MDYQREGACSRDEARVRDFLLQTFLPLGFRVESRDDSGARLRGPGMTNNWQNALLGLSEVRWRVAGGQVKLEADLGALRTFFKRMGWFLFGLAVFLFVVLGVVLWPLAPIFFLTIALPFAPWLILLPWLRSNLEKRARRALDNLLEGLSHLGA